MAEESQRKDETYLEEEGFLPDEDELVIADMSDLDRQPLLIPRFDILYKRKKGEDPQAGGLPRYPLHLQGEERWAMIRGTLAAALLVLGILAASFAGIIFLIGHFWG